MSKSINFPAPSALQRIGEVLCAIFKLQRKMGLEQHDFITEAKLVGTQFKVKTTLNNLYRLNLSDEVLVLAFLYIDMITNKENFFITEQNATGLLTVCVMIADKMLNDESYTSRAFSVVSGLKCFQLNQLEQIILEKLDHTLNISEKEFSEYLARFWNSD